MTIELPVRYHGSGKPLVLLHGLFGQSMNFQGIMRRLADEFECAALDLRNHGRSPHVASMSYLEMASDVADFVQTRFPEGAFVMGHSMGGKVAMALALTKPEVVTGLVVADIAPVTYQHDFDHVVAPLRRLDLTTIESRADADLRLRASIADAGLRGFLLTNLARGEAGWHWRINLPAIDAAMAELAAFPQSLDNRTFAGATLFLSGADSNYVNHQTHIDVCRRYFPNAKFTALDGAGHWLHADKPAEFAAALADFLGS